MYLGALSVLVQIVIPHTIQVPFLLASGPVGVLASILNLLPGRVLTAWVKIL